MGREAGNTARTALFEAEYHRSADVEVMLFTREQFVE